MPDKIILDASAALKWQFEDEPDTEPAVKMLRDYEEGMITFMVPQLFYYEIANAVHIAVRRERIREEEGRAILSDILSIETAVVDSPELVKDAYLNARKYGISVYDSVYFTLAKKEGALLYTGDRKFYDSVGSKKFVRWVGDYKRGARS